MLFLKRFYFSDDHPDWHYMQGHNNNGLFLVYWIVHNNLPADNRLFDDIPCHCQKTIPGGKHLLHYPGCLRSSVPERKYKFPGYFG